jgi:hypothetical protein
MAEMFGGENKPIFLLIKTRGYPDTPEEWNAENYFFPDVPEFKNLDFDWSQREAVKKLMQSGDSRRSYGKFEPWAILRWHERENYEFQNFLAKMIAWVGENFLIVLVPHYCYFSGASTYGAQRRQRLLPPLASGRSPSDYWKYRWGEMPFESWRPEDTYPPHEYHFDSLILNGGAERGGLGTDCTQDAAAAYSGHYGFKMAATGSAIDSDETNFFALDSSKKYNVKARVRVVAVSTGTFKVRAKWYKNDDDPPTASATPATDLGTYSAPLGWQTLDTSFGSGGAHAIPGDATHVRFDFQWTGAGANGTAYVDDFYVLPDTIGWGLIT